jgi:hypothetical protein
VRVRAATSGRIGMRAKMSLKRVKALGVASTSGGPLAGGNDDGRRLLRRNGAPAAVGAG